jgi:hypothetical protein
MHFSRVFLVIVAQNNEQNGLAFYVGIPKVTILDPPLGPMAKTLVSIHWLFASSLRSLICFICGYLLNWVSRFVALFLNTKDLWPFHFQLRHTSIFFRPPLLMA